jgi:hypothetical protein
MGVINSAIEKLSMKNINLQALIEMKQIVCFFFLLRPICIFFAYFDRGQCEEDAKSIELHFTYRMLMEQLCRVKLVPNKDSCY